MEILKITLMILGTVIPFTVVMMAVMYYVMEE